MRGGAYKERASSALYLRITSPFSSWYSRSDTRMMSPLLIQIFFLSLPRIRPRRLTPSKHCRLVSPGPSFFFLLAFGASCGRRNVPWPRVCRYPTS
jgi:hypothetical protein